MPVSDISYLQYIQAQQFPHIANFHQVPYGVVQQLPSPHNKTPFDIYENPSEHYASIGYNGGVINERGTQSSLPSHPQMMMYGGNSTFGSRNTRQPQYPEHRG